MVPVDFYLSQLTLSRKCCQSNSRIREVPCHYDAAPAVRQDDEVSGWESATDRPSESAERSAYESPESWPRYSAEFGQESRDFHADICQQTAAAGSGSALRRSEGYGVGFQKSHGFQTTRRSQAFMAGRYSGGHPLESAQINPRPPVVGLHRLHGLSSPASRCEIAIVWPRTKFCFDRHSSDSDFPRRRFSGVAKGTEWFTVRSRSRGYCINCPHLRYNVKTDLAEFPSSTTFSADRCRLGICSGPHTIHSF